MILLEKAYAKLFGTYDKIESGLAGHALRDLTGAPYIYHIRDDETEMEEESSWDFMIENFKKKYLITASSEKNTRHDNDGEDYLGILS